MPGLRGAGLLSVPRLASVFLNGFAGIALTPPVTDWRLPELIKVFCRVPSSSTLPPVPSDPALKGSCGESSCMLLGDSKSGGGEEGKMGGGENNLVDRPSSPSDVAECGEMIRTVLPVLAFIGRGRSSVH